MLLVVLHVQLTGLLGETFAEALTGCFLDTLVVLGGSTEGVVILNKKIKNNALPNPPLKNPHVARSWMT
jgi:hypothetical protein